MHILYDNTIFYLQRHGGISRYFSELINRLKLFEDVNIDTFKFLKILPRRIAHRKNFILDLKLMFSHHDIYHPTYYSSSVKKRKGLKTIVTVYDMIHEMFLSDYDSFKRDIEIKKSSILSADHIICISQTTKQDLKKIYHVSDSDITVVYLGSTLSLNGEKVEFKKSDRPYILYVGKRDYYKNFNILLAAFSNMELKKEFDLICFGGGRFSKSELAEFRRLGVGKAIFYYEGEDNLLRFYYKNSEVFVHTSQYEGFGLAALEAMDNECMVIASRAGSISEITGDAVLLFDPDNITELESCIAKIINDKQIKNEYIARGKERAKIFSWDNTAHETYKVYEKALRG